MLSQTLKSRIKDKILWTLLFTISCCCVCLYIRNQKILRNLEQEEGQTQSTDYIIGSQSEESENALNNGSANDSIEIADGLLQDKEYKVFFGEWEICDVIDGYGLADEDKLAHFLGMHLYYDFNSFVVDGEVITSDVIYKTAIIPTDKVHLFMNGRYSLANEEDVISQEQSYFINISAIAKEFAWSIGSNFYVKDKDTIILEGILDGKYFFLKCKRISYIDDYENLIPRT